MLFFATTLLATSASVLASVASPHGQGSHHGAAARSHNNVEKAVGNNTLAERGYEYNNQRATWWTVGEVACGGSYSTEGFYVALSQETFGYQGNSPYCYRAVVISYGGKTANAQIVDACVGCSDYSPWALDLSTGLFEHFAPMSVGVLSIDWSFADDMDTPAKTTTKHTTTHHSTSTHHTTSTHKTTSVQKTTSTTKDSTSTTPTSTSTSSAATATSSSISSGNWWNLNQFILNWENLLDAETSSSS